MIDEATLLCDRIQNLVNDALAASQSDGNKEKLGQLQQIRNAISNLEQVAFSVPEDLLRLRDNLAEAEIQIEAARQTLCVLKTRLTELCSLIQISSPNAKRRTDPNIKHARRHDITSQSAYEQPIIEVLREMGGSARVKVIKERLFEKMKDSLLPGDFEVRESIGGVIWWNSAQWARNLLRERGIIRNGSPRGLWELVDSQDADKDGKTTI